MAQTGRETLDEVRPASADEEKRNQQMEDESETKTDSVKPGLSEEDLEDWLDSMIS